MVTKDLICDEMSEEILKCAKELAVTEGAHNINVRKILNTLQISNRVFYNRFSNIHQVLEIVYRDAVYKMHENVKSQCDPNKDFFKYVMDIAVNVLINTYEIKMQFSKYMFEHDSLTNYNSDWWMDEIKKLIGFAKEKKLIKDIDEDKFAHTTWCFCHGFNADAVGKRMKLDDAIELFIYGFGCLLDGIKL